MPESERAGLVKIGEDVAERLEFDRMKPWVRRIIRPKYARPGDPVAGVSQAPPPLGVVEGSRQRTHPEAVLEFREDERRQADERMKDRRLRRRREKQLSQTMCYAKPPYKREFANAKFARSSANLPLTLG